MVNLRTTDWDVEDVAAPSDLSEVVAGNRVLLDHKCLQVLMVATSLAYLSWPCFVVFRSSSGTLESKTKRIHRDGDDDLFILINTTIDGQR